MLSAYQANSCLFGLRGHLGIYTTNICIFIKVWIAKTGRGELWGQSWLGVAGVTGDNAYQRPGGDNNRSRINNPRNTGERRRRRRSQQTKASKNKTFNGNKTLHWKPYKETKHRNSVLQHSLLTLKIVCTVRHHFKMPVKYCVLAHNTSECRGPGTNFGRQ